SVVQAFLGQGDEERHAAGEAIQPGKVVVAAVENVEGPGLDGQQIHRGHVGHFAAGNMDKTGNIAAQVQKRVQLDGAFALAELCPGQERKTQVDGGGIEGIN